MPLSTIGPIVFAVYLGAMVIIGLVSFRFVFFSIWWLQI